MLDAYIDYSSHLACWQLFIDGEVKENYYPEWYGNSHEAALEDINKIIAADAKRRETLLK
jgi:hypothetical protein